MTIKRVIVSIMIIMILNTTIFGKENLTRVESYPNRNDVYFLNGYRFEELDPSEHEIGLAERVDAEIDYISKRQNDKKNNGQKLDYTIVGYSEGGLRALAYAKRLKEQKPNEFENLKAVITVSGIDRGLKALNGGFTPLKAKVQEDVNIIYNGLCGFAMGLPLLSMGVLIFVDFSKDKIFDFINEISPYLDSYITCAWNGGTYSQLAEIYDMMPKSEFIKNNVAYTDPVTYPVRVGTNYVLGIESKKVLGIRIYYLVLKSEPKYDYYTSFKDKMLIDESIPIGYIVGTDSNTIGILNDIKDFNISESEVRTIANLTSLAMYTASAANSAKYIASLGLLTTFYNAARNCSEAGNWFRSIDFELNDLKGSNENDGLVAKESQFYPKMFHNRKTGYNESVHTKVLEQSEYGYVGLKYNHMNINPKTNSDTANRIKIMIDYADYLKNRPIINDDAK